MSWDERPYADGGFEPSGSHPRFSDNPMGWSLLVGRVAEINIRIHIFFFLFVLFEILSARTDVFHAVRWTLMLFSIVLLHEFGHCFAARRVGGSAHEVLLWPLGGLAMVQAPRTVRAQFLVAAGGPLVNVLLMAVMAPILIVLAQDVRVVPWNPFDVWSGARYLAPIWYKTIYTFYVVNFILLVFNVCLPIYPFDGGRMLQAVLWRYMGFGPSMQLATTIGMVGSIALGLIAIGKEQYLLLCIAAFGYISCLNERRLLAAGLIEEEGGYGFEADLRSDEPRPRRGGLRGWLERRRAANATRRFQAEQARMRQEDEEVDRILLKVHRDGIQSLTRAERKTLESATQRHRGPTINRKL